MATRDDYAEGELIALRRGNKSRGYAAQDGAQARVVGRAASISDVRVVWTCPLRIHPTSRSIRQSNGEYYAGDFVSLCPRKV